MGAGLLGASRDAIWASAGPPGVGRRGRGLGALCLCPREGSSWVGSASRQGDGGGSEQPGRGPGVGWGRAERGGARAHLTRNCSFHTFPTALAQLAQPPAGAGDAGRCRRAATAAQHDRAPAIPSGQVDQAAEALPPGHGLLHQRRHHLHRAVDRCRRHLVRVPGGLARARVFARARAPLAPPTWLEGGGRGPRPAPTPRPSLWPALDLAPPTRLEGKGPPRSPSAQARGHTHLSSSPLLALPTYLEGGRWVPLPHYSPGPGPHPQPQLLLGGCAPGQGKERAFLEKECCCGPGSYEGTGLVASILRNHPKNCSSPPSYRWGD